MKPVPGVVTYLPILTSGVDMPNRLALLASCVLLCVPLVTRAEKAADGTLEARVKALEQRVAELEARLEARPAQAPAVTVVPHAVQPGAPAPPPVWGSPEKWAQIKQGMGWSQVKDVLGPAGKKITGVFGDVWYYPDESGGRIVFDRDGRVAEFNAPLAR
ncbi:MAG: hypothetical protein JSS16_03900 [Proteobacteria bacterium]|nr:hypothetical protein [Pseudomonadota bacterium]